MSLPLARIATLPAAYRSSLCRLSPVAKSLGARIATPSRSSSLGISFATKRTAAAPARTFATSATMEEIGSTKVFGGYNKRYKHASSACGCDMIFAVYMPPQVETMDKVPVVYYLSGLTCTDENVIQKSGLQRKAAELGIAVVCPDTSPRGLNIEGELDSWDFGTGAGFYLDATEPKWAKYRMYEYVTKELPAALKSHLPKLDLDNAGIMGHSMGGHGALTIALKNPTTFKSVSAFAPICNPTKVPWGEKAFSNYLGADREAWKDYDATELAKKYDGPSPHILIDQGCSDNFLAVQLAPGAFMEVACAKAWDVTMRMQEGYDHSYFFIATFMDDHLEHHAKYLCK